MILSLISYDAARYQHSLRKEYGNLHLLL